MLCHILTQNYLMTEPTATTPELLKKYPAHVWGVYAKNAIKSAEKELKLAVNAFPRTAEPCERYSDQYCAACKSQSQKDPEIKTHRSQQPRAGLVWEGSEGRG